MRNKTVLFFQVKEKDQKKAGTLNIGFSLRYFLFT